MNKHGFENFELVKEYADFFHIEGNDKGFPFRLYRSDFTKDKYRWHFGFPKELVSILCPFLEATPYWGEQHWKEDDGFWIWWLTVASKKDEGIPESELYRNLKSMLRSWNMCKNFLAKYIKK